MVIIKIQLEELLLIKYYVVKHNRSCLNGYKSFDKKPKGNRIKSEITYKFAPNQQLADELYKKNIRKFQKGKLKSSCIDSIQSNDLADMEFISKYNNEIYCLLCVVDYCSKYA